MPTRRQWMQATASALALSPSATLNAGAKAFWDARDPASWTESEKLTILSESPWAQVGVAEFDPGKKRNTKVGYGNDGRIGTNMPSGKPNSRPGGDGSVPIGEEIPPVPSAHPGDAVKFPVLARWETASPVRLANGITLPEMGEQVYMISLRGLPLMPPPKVKRGEETPSDPNAAILQSIRRGSRLERKNKAPIACTKLFAGKAEGAREVLLVFPRDTDPITDADKIVHLECTFAPYNLSVKFTLKEMKFKGALTL